LGLRVEGLGFRVQVLGFSDRESVERGGGAEPHERQGLKGWQTR